VLCVGDSLLQPDTRRVAQHQSLACKQPWAGSVVPPSTVPDWMSSQDPVPTGQRAACCADRGKSLLDCSVW
jgi:hypothetical protein